MEAYRKVRVTRSSGKSKCSTTPPSTTWAARSIRCPCAGRSRRNTDGRGLCAHRGDFILSKTGRQKRRRSKPTTCARRRNAVAHDDRSDRGDRPAGRLVKEHRRMFRRAGRLGGGQRDFERRSDANSTTCDHAERVRTHESEIGGFFVKNVLPFESLHSWQNNGVPFGIPVCFGGGAGILRFAYGTCAPRRSLSRRSPGRANRPPDALHFSRLESLHSWQNKRIPFGIPLFWRRAGIRPVR